MSLIAVGFYGAVASLTSAAFWAGVRARVLSKKPKRRKAFRFRVTTEYVVDLPEDWTEEMAELWANHSDWCVSEMFRRLAEQKPCACDVTKLEVMRDET